MHLRKIVNLIGHPKAIVYDTLLQFILLLPIAFHEVTYKSIRLTITQIMEVLNVTVYV